MWNRACQLCGIHLNLKGFFFFLHSTNATFDNHVLFCILRTVKQFCFFIYIFQQGPKWLNLQTSFQGVKNETKRHTLSWLLNPERQMWLVADLRPPDMNRSLLEPRSRRVDTPLSLCCPLGCTLLPAQFLGKVSELWKESGKKKKKTVEKWIFMSGFRDQPSEIQLFKSCPECTWSYLITSHKNRVKNQNSDGWRENASSGHC